MIELTNKDGNPTSTGQAQGDAVYKQVKDWNCDSKVVALVCDTTASNTGKDRGAMVRLHRHLKVPLLYLACCHHTSELLAKNPWEASFGKSPAPDVKIFLKIKEHWNEIDTSLEIRTVKIPSEKREELLELFNCLLEKGEFIRGDYKELAEISITMLGGTLPGGKAMVWKKPGPCHKARFMAFGLLVLKIFAFSNQQVVKDRCLSDAVKDKESKTTKFIYNSEEEQKIEQFCVFALSFYIPTFFTSSRGCDAPINDLRLYKDLLTFKDSDEILASKALDTMDRHLWYLTPAVVMFSLFSEKVSEDTKSRMAAKLLSLERVEETKVGLPEFPAVEAKMELWDFVTSQSWVFFDTIKMSADWLVQPPADWEKSED